MLVVGASATGIQLAEEIHRSGRHVTLAVGEHVRMPRTYRGRDIFWWTDAAGILDERYDALDDVVRARHLPSPQLIGTPQRRSIDLNSLRDLGVRIVGRLGRLRDGVAQFSGSLPNTCALADLKMNRLLATLDQWATLAGVDDEVERPERFEPTRIPSPRTEIDLERDDIRTVIWATGYRPDHRWIDLPVFDHKGMIRHDGGVVRGAPGMYVLGLNVLRRRGSSFIGGAERDTAELAAHLHLHLDCPGHQPTANLRLLNHTALVVAVASPRSSSRSEVTDRGALARWPQGDRRRRQPRHRARHRHRASGRRGVGGDLRGGMAAGWTKRVRRSRPPAAGAWCSPVPTDLADGEDTRAFMREAIDALDGLDIYVHSASGFGDESERGWLRTLEIDLMAAVRGVEVALPALEASDAGSIVLIGSTASVQSFGRAGAGATGYGPAKAAQRVR